MIYPFILPALLFSLDALEPYMSKETLEYHYGKHAAAYVNNLNNLVRDTPMEKLTLEDIIKTQSGSVFNNAAQVWNHKFFFDQFSSTPRHEPDRQLKGALEKSFGSVEQFKTEFTQSAIGLFGSGWVWLVVDRDGALKIIAGANAETPVRDGVKPLLVIDVWEHAYYIDYRNRRADFIAAFWKMLDWKIIDERYRTAMCSL